MLVTGFGPFPGAPSNPTQQLVARLVRLRRPATAALRLVTHVFPTSYAAVDQQLPELIDKHQPDAIVMFGLAGRSKAIRIETLARNRISRVYPDMDRKIPPRTGIAPGEATRRGRAPFARLAAAVRASGLPVRFHGMPVLTYAITAYWRALEQRSRTADPRLVVFVHVPNMRRRRRTSARTKTPDLDQLLRAAQNVVIAAAAAVRRQD